MKTVLIDGWCGNHRRLERMRGNLGRPETVEIWVYDSSGWTALETLGGVLAAHLRSLGSPFHAVGYSMGGLVLREALRQAPELPLRRAAFLHTPHQGTVLARFVDRPAVREMRPGSDFLRGLDQAKWNAPALNVWCPGDLIVVPGWKARWAGATEEVRCDVPGHVWPLVSRPIHHTIQHFFDRDAGTSGNETENGGIPRQERKNP